MNVEERRVPIICIRPPADCERVGGCMLCGVIKHASTVLSSAGPHTRRPERAILSGEVLGACTSCRVRQVRCCCCCCCCCYCCCCCCLDSCCCCACPCRGNHYVR